MTTFQVLKDTIKQSIQKFKNWRKIRICKSLNHRTSNYKIISTTVIQDWTNSLNNQQIRTVCLKCHCENCHTTFILNNRWEFRDSDEQFSFNC